MTLFKYTIKKAIKYMIILLTIVIFLLIGNTNALLVHAENVDITTSSVRDDLKSMDEDKLSYLSDEEFIFIGMSQYYDKDNNLRTYLYANIPYDISTFDYNWYATISTSVMDENYNITEDFKLYPINYVNHEETWYKLEVLDLPNLEETTRRYYIQDLRVYEEVKTYANVVRPGIPDEGGGGNLDDDTSTPSDDYMFCDEVSKVYVFNGISNNTIQVLRQEVETITITEKEVNFYCYGDDLDILFWESEGIADGTLDINNTYKDIWYIFFNTDKPMDELMEIELTYQEYQYNICATSGTMGMNDPITENKYNEIINDLPLGYQTDYYKDKFYLNKKEQVRIPIYPGEEKVETDTSNWYGKHTAKYEILDNILNLKEYQAKDSDKFVFTEQANKYDWGVKFLVTDKFVKETMEMSTGAVLPAIIEGSGVSNTAILRLKYQTNGIVHNAYAVDVPTDDFDGNIAEEDDPNLDLSKITEWFEKIMMVIGILVLLVLLNTVAPIFTAIFKGLFFCIKWSIKGIWLVISAPFKIIGSLFKKKRKGW